MNHHVNITGDREAASEVRIHSRLGNIMESLNPAEVVAETAIASTTEAVQELKLNLGGGGIPIEGFTEVDAKSGGTLYPVACMNGDGTAHAVAEGTCSELRASHVLEHFSHRASLNVLGHWVSLLKPGGKIKIAVPDFDLIVRAYLQKRLDWPVESYLFGGQIDANDFHYASFTEDTLRFLMHSVGLERIRRWKSDIQDCASLHVSLNLEGYKSFPLAKFPANEAQAIFSMPRLGFTDNFRAAQNSFIPLDIPVRVCRGVYFEQAMTQGIAFAIKDGAKYIFTGDYDSTYDWRQVRELHRLMEANPHADAICSLQIRRDMDSALITITGPDGKIRPRVAAEEFDTDLVPIDTGHFGLTILRASKFEAMAKPWFIGIPGADGMWGEDRVDADIVFWRRWRACGNTLFVAPGVSIGHLQLVNTCIDRKMQRVHQDVAEWYAGGPPHTVLR